MVKNKKHPWDETMVITVMVVSALCILFMLTSYIAVTGEAVKAPTQISVANIFSSATPISGAGKAICRNVCDNVGQACLLGHMNNNLVECDAKINGDYVCLCTIRKLD